MAKEMAAAVEAAALAEVLVCFGFRVCKGVVRGKG